MSSERPHLPDAETTWRAPWPLELVRVLNPLRRGKADPCHVVVDARTIWRCTRTPLGPVTAWLRQRSAVEVECRAWGPGAEWFVDHLPNLLGVDDQPHEFDHLDHPLLRKLHNAHPWLRMPRTNLVFEALPYAVLEQRVLVAEAFAGQRWMIRHHGEAAPAAPGAPAILRIGPSAEAWRLVPSWDWHQAGVDVHRAATIVRCARIASRLDEVAHMDRFEGVQRLRSVRGVGIWTAAEVRQRALGDADAVSYGDVHLARFVGYALTGQGVDDPGMHELLAPWAGHRHRVIRLLQLGVAHGIVQTAPRIARPRPRAHLRY